MRKLVNRVAVVALIGLPVIAGTATAAGASTEPHGIKLSTSGGSASAKVVYAFAGPKAKIVGAGATAVFKPTALTTTEDTSGNQCNPFYEEAELKNKGTATAFLTIDGGYAGKLPAHEATFLCSYGYGAGGQITIGLAANKKATKLYASTLTITFSD